MPTSRRRRDRGSAYHHGALPEALLQAAGELLEAHGPAALSLRETARRAGVSHAAPYRHYKDREALLAAVAAEGFQRLEGAISAGPRPGAEAMGLAYVRFALAHPQRFRLMFGGVLGTHEHPELRESAARAFSRLVDAFAALGGDRDARVAAAAAWSLVHGLSQLLLEGHLGAAERNREDTERFARQVIGAVRFTLGAQRAA